jgi:hypothetical protein
MQNEEEDENEDDGEDKKEDNGRKKNVTQTRSSSLSFGIPFPRSTQRVRDF